MIDFNEMTPWAQKVIKTKSEDMQLPSIDMRRVNLDRRLNRYYRDATPDVLFAMGHFSAAMEMVRAVAQLAGDDPRRGWHRLYVSIHKKAPMPDTAPKYYGRA